MLGVGYVSLTHFTSEFFHNHNKQNTEHIVVESINPSVEINGDKESFSNYDLFMRILKNISSNFDVSLISHLFSIYFLLSSLFRMFNYLNKKIKGRPGYAKHTTSGCTTQTSSYVHDHERASRNPRTALANFHTRFQLENEPLSEFADTLKSLAEQVFANLPSHEKNDHIKSQFLDGLRNLNLKKELIRSIGIQRQLNGPELLIDDLVNFASSLDTFTSDSATTSSTSSCSLSTPTSIHPSTAHLNTQNTTTSIIKQDNNFHEVCHLHTEKKGTQTNNTHHTHTTQPTSSSRNEVGTNHVNNTTNSMSRSATTGTSFSSRHNNHNKYYHGHSSRNNHNNNHYYKHKGNFRSQHFPHPLSGENSSMPNHATNHDNLSCQQFEPPFPLHHASQPDTASTQPHIINDLHAGIKASLSVNVISMVDHQSPVAPITGFGLLNGVLVEYLYDDGADDTIISFNLFMKIATSNFPVTLSEYTGPNISSCSGKLPIYGSVSLEECIIDPNNPLLFKNSQVVVAKLTSKYDCIVGRNFIYKIQSLKRIVEDLRHQVYKMSETVFDEYKSRKTDANSIEINSLNFDNVEFSNPKTDRLSEEQKIPLEDELTFLLDYSTVDNEAKINDYLEKFRALINKKPERAHELLCVQINHLLRQIGASCLQDLTPTDVIKHKIILNNPNIQPIKRKLRVMPFSLKKDLLKLINEQLEACLIQPSDSPWSFPIKLVRKKDGSIRMTINYRPLNDITIKDAYPLPNIEDLLRRLANALLMTKIDCYSGFYQVVMDASSRQYTAFSCEYGHFEYKVMPMGLSNSPATFQRLMNSLLFDFITAGFVVVFIDDILIHSSDEVEHLKHVLLVVMRLWKHGLKVKLSKCEVAKLEVRFLGHVISRGHMEPDPDKVAALFQFETPITLRQLLSFMGLATYYRKFIPEFARIAKPLYDLMCTKHLGKAFKKKNGSIDGTKVILSWDEDCISAFNTLRKILCSDKILILPDFESMFYLSTDACDYAYGAVLEQLVDHEFRPIAYFSRNMSKAQRNYSTSEKELLAMVESIEHFHEYLYGRSFVVFSDHLPLSWLLKNLI